MSIKRVLCPAQVRRIPPKFSWIDQRLVRHRFIGSCGTEALALYLFLVTVADAQGLSYYSDRSILSRLSCLDTDRLAQARTELQRVGWIAYQKPLYQVLTLDIPIRSDDPQLRIPDQSGPLSTRHRTAEPVEMIKLLRRALEGHHDSL